MPPLSCRKKAALCRDIATNVVYSLQSPVAKRRLLTILGADLRHLFSISACLALALGPAAAQVSVWTYHNDNHRTGLNTNEVILNPTNVSSTSFGRLFKNAVDGNVYAQPLYVPGLTIPGRGTHNVFFIATEHNTVYAFDADVPAVAGGLLWQTNLGPAAVTTTSTFTNKNFGTRYNGGAYTDIIPEVGITGTPVIDLSSGTLYVDAFTGVAGIGVTNYSHHLHALNIATGAEQPGSPVLITASVPGVGVGSVGNQVPFNAKQENQRCALTLAGGIVYVAYAGYADTDPYHGWIIGFNATNLLQLTNYVFNATPNSTVAAFGANAGEGGLWMSGGGLAVDDNTNLFFELGNGSFNVTNGSNGTEYGDSFMRLSTTNGLAVADYFTPWNQATLQANDTDVGSGGLLLLPDQPGPFPHEMLGAGKQGQIYVINREQMTTGNNHFDATNSIDFVVQTNSGKIKGSFDTPGYFNGRIYYASSADNLKALALTNGALAGNTILTNRNRTFNFPGATPSISANGTNSGIVWALQMPSAYGNPAVLVACNATNLAEIYTSTNNAGRDQLDVGVKFAVPTVADGRVFVGSSNSVSVFSLLGGIFAFSSPAFNVPAADTNAVITVYRLGGTNGAAQVSYATVSGGTASNGVDYTSISGLLNWTNGESGAKTFTVPILANNVVQSNVSVNLALSNPTNGTSAIGPPSAAVLTIIQPPISAWKLAYFGADANNPAIAGDTADPQQDGIVNLLAYAYAFNPLVVNTNPFTGNLAGIQFQVHFLRNLSASDLTYVLQSSTTLTNWSDLLTYTAAGGWVMNLPGATVAESATNGVPPNQYVDVTATISLDAINRFLRLEVHR